MPRHAVPESNARLVRSLLLVALAALPAAGLAASEPHYDVCTDQIRAYVREHFDQTVTRIDFQLHNDSVVPKGFDTGTNDAIVYVAECPGYYWFELLTNEWGCKYQAHYGKVPNYLMFRSANDGC